MTSHVNAAGTTTDPGRVWALVHGFTEYWTALAAVRLGVFDALSAGPAPPAELAARCGADPGRLVVLCDALVGSGLLERVDGAYVLAPVSDAYLVSGRPGAMVDLLGSSPGPHENWPELDATVRRGEPRAPLDDDPSGGFYALLARATFATQHAVARRVGPDVWGSVGAARLLELGAGGAPWSAALLASCPSARATVNDLPGVVPEARATLSGPDVRDRVELVPGDYLDVELDVQGYDVVVLGHVLRAEPDDRARALVARAAQAVRAGGAVVVADYFLEDDRRGPRNALLLGVTMMASTRHGRVLTAAQCRGWLVEAGLVAVEMLEPIPQQRLMVARDPRDPSEGSSR